MDRAPVYGTGCREFESLQVHCRSVAQWKRRISDEDVVVGSNPTRPIYYSIVYKCIWSQLWKKKKLVYCVLSVNYVLELIVQVVDQTRQLAVMIVLKNSCYESKKL